MSEVTLSVTVDIENINPATIASAINNMAMNSSSAGSRDRNASQDFLAASTAATQIGDALADLGMSAASDVAYELGDKRRERRLELEAAKRIAQDIIMSIGLYMERLAEVNDESN